MDLERHESGVYVLSMRNGENRMNRDWVVEFGSALDRVEADSSAHALVTTGTGRFYSNGLDLEWLLSPDTEPMPAFVADVERVFARLLAFPIITVAACNGHTFAAGAMLALSHDFRVMRFDRGFFCLPEVEIRIPFTPGMDALIRSRLTKRTAHELMVTGRRLGGDEAAAREIVDEAVPEGEVRARAIAIASEFGGKDRAALRTIKQRMYAEPIALLSDSPGTEPLASA